MPILIMGLTGSGKTTAFIPNAEIGIKGLNPDETSLFMCAKSFIMIENFNSMYRTEKENDKPKNFFLDNNGFQSVTQIAERIKQYDKLRLEDKTPIKNIVIDDWFQLLSKAYFEAIDDRNAFKKFDDMIRANNLLIGAIKSITSDLLVFVTGYAEREKDDFGNLFLDFKTIGRGTDKYIVMPGHTDFLILSSQISNGKYGFRIIGKLGEAIKTPHYFQKWCTKKNIFDADTNTIPNDASYIEEAIRSFMY